MSDNRVFFIAEAGVNHNGSLPTALAMVDAAADAGADAVKFQTAIPEEVVSVHAPKARYQERNTGERGSQLNMLRALHFGVNRVEAHRALLARAQSRGIALLSTPFDLASLVFLRAELGLTTIKIASGDLTYGPLLLESARSDADIILSTGMGDPDEIEAALGVLAFGFIGGQAAPGRTAFRRAFADQRGQELLRRRVTLLHCVTAYPAPAAQSNLKAMASLKAKFGLRVGYSDHTVGTAMAVAAAALGAVMIEKHFTLNRAMLGPDHAASLEPAELASLIADIRRVEQGLGSGIKEPQPCEQENMAIARRSLVARVPVRRGELLTPDNVATKRPAGGLSPLLYWEILGTPAERDFAADEAINGEVPDK